MTDHSTSPLLPLNVSDRSEGTAIATSTFTVTLSRAGLGYVNLASGAGPTAIHAITVELAHGQCAELAKYVNRQAGMLVSDGRGSRSP